VRSNRLQHIFAISIGMAFLTAATFGAAADGDDHGYRTDRLVPSNHNECAGVPDCFPTTLPAVHVEAKGRTSERFACPSDHPNVWAWDAAQHEQIRVQLISTDRSSVTIEGVNAADTPGDFIVSLGCSIAPYTGSGMQQSRLLAPTALLPLRRPPPPFVPPVREKLKMLADPDQVGAEVCNNVPFCQPQQEPTFSIGGWETTTKSYECKAPYPYAWDSTYTQTGSPSVSSMSVVHATYPGYIDLLMTNWNIFATDDVTVTVACSKSNSFGGECGAPQSDPGCPVVNGSSHQYCSKGPVPVCFSDFQERCPAPTKQLFSCTIDVIVTWCQPCPG
jgi:hypothetical protein